jgi:drug/metabolite transporter (DMT)-like permease
MIMGRWFDMINTEGMGFLENTITNIGFFTSTILMTLAVVIVIVAAFQLYKQRLKAMKYVGITLFLVGLQYIFRVIYSSYLGFSFDYLMLVDIWTIPFLFLGMALIVNNANP